MVLTTRNSDYIGAIAGVLCIIHCIITPLLFLINAELANKANTICLTAYWICIFDNIIFCSL